MFLKIIIIFVVIVIAVVFRNWMSKNYSYICPNCSNKFKPEILESMLSLHIGGKRRLRCPKCGQKSFMDLTIDKYED